MRALDLFSCAGGAGYGLHLAGFEVVGVDIDPQPRYPFEHHVADALTFPLGGFDFVWASPPCQRFTAYRRKDPSKIGAGAPNLIPAIRKRLRESGIPFVIENVEGSPLKDPVTLCGSMFDRPIRRHRLFETSFPVTAPSCRHEIWKHNRFPCAGNRTNPRKTLEIGVWRIPLEMQQQAMGIDWTTLPELSQAIPPCYSHFLANEFLRSRT